MIAELGTEDADKKRTRGGIGGIQEIKEREDGNDDFGMQDEDWNIYREIQKDGFSEDEEQDQADLGELEDQIADLDPKF